MITHSRPMLGIALDYSDIEDNLRLVDEIVDHVDCLKINDDAVDHIGMQGVIRPFLQYNIPLFLDMKMFKGQRTMIARARMAKELGVTYVNAFALADRLLAGVVEELEGSNTHLLALTVLSHFDDEYCVKFFGLSLDSAIYMFTDIAVKQGCHGVILPASTLQYIGDIDTFKVTPGIRPEWDSWSTNDQISIATPKFAVENGSDLLICGSPISKYPKSKGGPKEGAKLIKEEMITNWRH